MSTDQALNIAVAKACGWTRIQMGISGCRGGKSLLNSYSELKGTPPHEKDLPEDDQSFVPVPDYGADLNACRDAEECLTSEECQMFERCLARIFDGTSFSDGAKSWQWHASANQRRECFLRAKNIYPS